MIRPREDWLNWLATSCMCNHIRPEWLEIDGYCTHYDVSDIKRIIRTRQPSPAHAAAESINGISIERVPVQLELFP